MKKIVDNYKIISWLLWGGIVCLVGVNSYSNLKSTTRNSPDTYRLSTKDKYLIANTKNGVADITVVNKTTGYKNQYQVDLSDSLKKINNMPEKYSREQEEYQKNNGELITQASRAYGAIIANDYKIVRFCSKYHPVTKWKNVFDAHFQDKKHKAERILDKAYGPSTAKNFEYAFATNPNVIKFYEQQIEEDYLNTKAKMQEEGYYNFSRIEYCQMLDDDSNISLYLKTLDTEFKSLLPSF